MFKELGAFIDAVGSAVGTAIRRTLSDESTEPDIDGLMGDIDYPPVDEHPIIEVDLDEDSDKDSANITL